MAVRQAAPRMGLLIRGLSFWWLMFVYLALPVGAQEAPLLSQAFSDDDGLMPNLPLKTLGGRQFWSDVRFCGTWHIQRNAVTNHYRLLDGQQVRRAWGTREACDRALEQARSAGQIEPLKGRVVVLLHGLGRSHESMSSLGQYLADNHDFQIINFQYASSRASVQQHAADLGSVLRHLGPEVTEIHFVGHSLGNLVVRSYVHQRTSDASSTGVDPRIQRMVMLGPPNQGSKVARRLAGNLVFEAFAGVSGRQLSRTWGDLEAALATPPFSFAIIAGGSESPNRLEERIFEGPSDFTVSVQETELVGAADSLTLPVLHGWVMHDDQVQQAVANFLSYGYLLAPDRMQPIRD